MVYLSISHNLDTPNKARNRTKQISKQLSKWLKPQIINPHSYQHPYQTLTTFKTPIYNIWHRYSMNYGWLPTLTKDL